MLETIAMFFFVPLFVFAAYLVYQTITVFQAKNGVFYTLEAYRLKKLKNKIDASGIDYNEMMQEFFSSMELLKEFKKSAGKKGCLEKIDAWVDGEFQENEIEKKAK